VRTRGVCLLPSSRASDFLTSLVGPVVGRRQQRVYDHAMLAASTSFCCCALVAQTSPLDDTTWEGFELPHGRRAPESNTRGRRWAVILKDG
jgi:hypothetical protein